MDKPTKPGWYYANYKREDFTEAGSVIVEVRKHPMQHLTCSCLGEFQRIGSPRIEWGEPVPTLAELQQLRAERDTLKKQVEFLEWMAWMEREFGFTHVNRGGVVVVKKADGWPVVSWSGQLRDGWQHLDAIKEAVK